MSELTYAALLRELFPRLTGGIRWGLERTLALLEAVGNPHESFRSVHVGGTNGKGSVAATLAAILHADGRPTGLYSSPHLCTFRERIQIDGVAISEAEITHAASRLWPEFGRLTPSFFEATTAIAFLALAEAGVDCAVIEVGLGGRLDATNVITPELAVITNIALDHAEYLGNTIESVAREKAGIIKPGVPLLTAENEVVPLDVFRRRAAELGAPLFRLLPHEISGAAYDLNGTHFRVSTVHYGNLQLSSPLIGLHQATNAALAARAADLLPPTLRPSTAAVVAGVSNVVWPGRLQMERIGTQRWLFDVAHNLAGVQALVAAVRGLDLARPLVIVVGILGDKDWQAMLPPLFELADLAVLTVPPTAPANRAWEPERVLEDVGSERTEVLRDFTAALDRARERAADGTVLVTGSFHTVGDALIALDRAPFGSDSTLPLLAFSG